jgi:hypothetical protein
MDVDELAGVAASTLALRLGAGAADPLVAAISRRLQLSDIGKRALAGLRGNPGDAWQRELAAAVIADELTRGPVFERALTEALGSAGGNAVKQHRVRGKRFRLGPFQFGGWGLAALIVVGALLVTGTGVVVFRNVAGPTSVAPTTDSRTGIHGVPLDVDSPRDQVPDVIFGAAGVAAAKGAAIGPRPVGTTLSSQACASAVDAYGRPIIATVKVGDVMCVRTSQGGVAAVTLAKPDRVDWLYWRRT